MTRRILLVLFSALLAAVPAAADELQDISRDFRAWRAIHQPVSDDDIPRVDRPAGWTPEWTRASIERRRRDLGAFEERLGRLDQSGMPVAWQVDRRLLRSAFARVHWELDVERGWERNPVFYVQQTVGALLDRLLPAPPFSRARSADIAARLASIPATVESAKGNLDRAEAPFARLAIAQLADVRPKLLAVVSALKPQLAGQSAGALDASAGRAIAALEGYREWLGNRLPSLRAQTAVGRDAYLFFLRNVALIPSTPEELLELGRLEWARAVALQTYEEMKMAAAPPLAPSADVASQSVRVDRDEAAIRRFLEEKSLLTVPKGIRRYRQLAVPAWLTPFDGFGEMDDLGSPSRPGEDALRWISPPSPDLGYFALADAKDPRPGIVHEGIPGHVFQLALSSLHEDPIRRHYFDSSANEGIAFYAEEMMLHAGFFDDSPRTRATVASFLRLRALRVEADVQLALGNFSIDQAADYLARTVPMDAASAREEAAFFASTPGQAISYQAGKAQILRFLADARRTQGEKFSLKAFHDSLWKNGNVPIALQRWELLGLRDDVDRLDRK